MKEHHAGSLDHIETRELADSLFLVGPGQNFDPELDSVAVVPGDPFEGLGESKGEGQGEIKPDVAAVALPLEGGEAGATESKLARVEIPVVVAKVVVLC